MANITLRLVKGTELTLQEGDDNFNNLNNQLPNGLSYDSDTGILTLSREVDSDLTVDLSDNVAQFLSYNSITRELTLGRPGTDIVADLDIPVTTTATGITMAVGNHYQLTDSGQTMTLPTGVKGDERLELSVRNFDTSIVARNGNKIMGVDSDLTVDIPYAQMEFLFVDSAFGWFIG